MTSMLLKLILVFTLRVGLALDCKDQSPECSSWAGTECLGNPYFMRAKCTASCKVRPACPQPKPPPWRGHATAAATRLYGNTYLGAVLGSRGFRHYRLDSSMGSWLPGADGRRHRLRSDPWLTLSSLGVGTYLGAEDEATDEQVVSALILSLKRGWNVVDTARNYRQGRGETAVGIALDALLTSKEGLSRSMFFISTKAGFLTPSLLASLKGGGELDEAEVVSGHCLAPVCLEASLTASLAALNLATVDCLYLHNAAELQLAALGAAAFRQRLRRAFEWLEGARARGLIRAYGMASWDSFRKARKEDPGALQLLEVVRLAEEVGGEEHGFRYVQLPVNAVMREAYTARGQEVEAGADLSVAAREGSSPPQREGVSLLEAAARLGVGVFASGPLAEGSLLSEEARPKLEAQLLGRPALAPVAGPAPRLLQIARSTPLVLAAVVGHKAVAHVEQNTKLSLQAPLTPEQYEALFQPRGGSVA